MIQYPIPVSCLRPRSQLPYLPYPRSSSAWPRSVPTRGADYGFGSHVKNHRLGCWRLFGWPDGLGSFVDLIGIAQSRAAWSAPGSKTIWDEAWRRSLASSPVTFPNSLLPQFAALCARAVRARRRPGCPSPVCASASLPPWGQLQSCSSEPPNLIRFRRNQFLM